MLLGTVESYAGPVCEVRTLLHYQPEHQALEFGLQTLDTHIKTNELRRKYLVTCFRSINTYKGPQRSLQCDLKFWS